jgi:integrase
MSNRKSTRGAQGAGTIRQRPDGRWEARYTVGRDPGTGKQIQKSVYGLTQAEVRKKLQQISVDLENGTYTEPSKLTVGAWLDIWLKDYNKEVKPRTLNLYTGQCNHRIKPGLGAVRLAALRPHDVQGFLNQQGQDTPDKPALSAKSIINLHGILHKALEQAVSVGYIKTNPSSACKPPKWDKPDIKPLDEKQIAAFLQAIKGHPYETLYMVDLFTGMRQGELLGLTWDCINFQSGTIHIRRQLQLINGTYNFTTLKNDKTRYITPAKEIMRLLQEHQRKQIEWQLRAGAAWQNNDGFVFTDELGKHLARQTIYQRYKRIVNDIGIPKARFHDLRHSYGVASIRAGDDIKTLQENMGHHSAAFTLDTYGHVTEQMKQESAARMDKFIQSVSTE